jgi:hypothetical protein
LEITCLKTKLLPLTAILAVSIYLVFTLAAVLSYPHPYSPLTNWLSDFGNPTRNPTGAVYYNTGGILASAVLVLFFAGLYTLKSADKKAQVFLVLSQITGIVFAFCFFMSAMVPLGVNDSLHSVFSMMLFVFLGFFEIFSASAIRRKPFNAKPLFFFGIFAAMINFVFGVSFNFMNLFVGEWIMIAVFIAYIITFALNQNVQSKNT